MLSDKATEISKNKRSSAARREEQRARARILNSLPADNAQNLVPSTQSPDNKARHWAGPDGDLGKYLVTEADNTLEAYRAQPNLIEEHANTEEDAARGGYANRQVMELVQNSADALSETAEDGRVHVLLSDSHLYCADNGRPIDKDGIKALMFAHMSPKRGTSEIGRFGLGFKSVLGVTESPEFFSKQISFRFDQTSAKSQLSAIAPNARRYPTLRIPQPIDPVQAAANDPQLTELMDWASNIVRLPLSSDAADKLRAQLTNFKPEFLLFVLHVKTLKLQDIEQDEMRAFTLDRPADESGIYNLSDGDISGHWKIFKRMHRLSDAAKADSRSLDDNDELPIWWAAPLGSQYRVGDFWAFFPTQTRSLLAGILNAPWKTNEDRQNLLEGPYNDELIRSSAELVVDSIPQISAASDPAKHLELLPRRERESDTGQTKLFRSTLFSLLHKQPILPDRSGKLRHFDELRYPPATLMQRRTSRDSKLEETLKTWYDVATVSGHWIHQSAFRNRQRRWAAVDRLCDPQGRLSSDGGAGTPEISISQWLEALVEGKSGDDAIEASKAAIHTAALLPENIEIPRSFGRIYVLRSFGKIILTQDNNWASIDPETVFLPGENTLNEIGSGTQLVHQALASDNDAVADLDELGISELSAEIQFESIAKRARYWDKAGWQQWGELFWRLSRPLDPGRATEIISDHLPPYSDQPYWNPLRVRTLSGKWRPGYSVLLPGKIVPSDGSRDADITVNMDFHNNEDESIKDLICEDSIGSCIKHEPPIKEYLRHHREKYIQCCAEKYAVKSTPRDDYLDFYQDYNAEPYSAPGPLEVLKKLTIKGKALYTDSLLSDERTYVTWVMSHKTQRKYPEIEFESPTIWMLRKYGMIETSERIVQLSDVIDSPHRYRDALVWIDNHPQSENIRDAFNLPKPRAIVDELTPFEAEMPIQLIDEWPGLEPHLSPDQKGMRLIRCEKIVTDDGSISEIRCFLRQDGIFLSRLYGFISDPRAIELNAVSKVLELELYDFEIRSILTVPTRAEIDRGRDEVRSKGSDAERLLAAVGESNLRSGLPDSLLTYMRRNGGTLSDIDVAEAAISTYHTGALKRYKDAISHLDPPEQMAGGRKAVSFVHSLGFSDEWAGDRNIRRDPFEEVMGPYSLPDLHYYQEKIVARLRRMIRPGPLDPANRRCMISLPTGSGKTRVAVQGLVDAMREGDLDGGVLWVADRDELCEQAVESWRQVWMNRGIETKALRISRMWDGQPPPIPTSDLHVVVATIQTLRARLNQGQSDYGFLRDFNLVVFDEAHRSIASTFTSAMAEIGFTSRQRSTEPFLVGLTATPYRGLNPAETQWLTRRYGSNRLDRGAFASDDPNEIIKELQNDEVLARADHENIEGGRFELNAQEREQAMAAPWLPQSAEIRLARDSDRTQRILGAYHAHVGVIGSEAAALIFATSVEHAQTLSALLNSDGVKARAVSGETDRITRRRVVDEFRAGEIKALVNYGVFREGFDAPKTRAIIVARPVYSPNLYFQMIGRGLRGVKNGGNDRCLIINVRDNIENFERKLAFSELDWLWD